MSETVSVKEYGVLIRAWGPDDEPGESRSKEYIVEAEADEQAKEKAVEEAKSFVGGIIETRDSYDVLEIECYGEAEA